MISQTHLDGFPIKALDSSQEEEFLKFIEKNRDYFINTIPVAGRVVSLETSRKELKDLESRQKSGLGEFYALYNGEEIIAYFLI